MQLTIATGCKREPEIMNNCYQQLPQLTRLGCFLLQEDVSSLLNPLRYSACYLLALNVIGSISKTNKLCFISSEMLGNVRTVVAGFFLFCFSERKGLQENLQENEHKQLNSVLFKIKSPSPSTQSHIYLCCIHFTSVAAPNWLFKKLNKT